MFDGLNKLVFKCNKCVGGFWGVGYMVVVFMVKRMIKFFGFVIYDVLGEVEVECVFF